jgi:hydroxyethylthiazole kinase-like sugar kinase family protein
METYSVLTPRTVGHDDLAKFITSNGGHLIDPGLGCGCIESGAAAVYIGIEEEKDRDWDAMRTAFPTPPAWLKSVVLLTVSRGNGSIELSFKVLDKLLERWGGVINWAGLDDWQVAYQHWRASFTGPEPIQ